MLQNRERREREMSIVAQFFMIMGGVLTGYVGIGLAAAIGKLAGYSASNLTNLFSLW